MKNRTISVYVGNSAEETYISPKILAVNIRFDSYGVPQHPCHCVLPEYDNFLIEKLDSTRIRAEMRTGDFVSESGDDGRE